MRKVGKWATVSSNKVKNDNNKVVEVHLKNKNVLKRDRYKNYLHVSL